MIPHIIQKYELERWQTVMKQAYRSVTALLHDLNLPQLATRIPVASKNFPCLVPKRYATLMEKGNPLDPLLLQVMPQPSETQSHPHTSADPLRESEHNPVPGLLHKYHGRVLLTLNSACAIHCRYCFRREFPYPENRAFIKLDEIMTYLKHHREIDEVILSGGDPLMLSDQHWQHLFTSLRTLPQIKRLRIHSRIPIVLPERLTENFLTLCQQQPWEWIMVVHCNHPNEIDALVAQKLQALRSCHFTVLNQAVLLKQINDSADSLMTLHDKLFQVGVLPYYLHQLDPVSGSAHFAVPLARGRDIMRELSKRSPGYLVPKYVYEKAHADHKVLIQY